jgi:hypothetical protein
MLIYDDDESFKEFLTHGKEVKEKWFKKLDNTKNKGEK